MDSGFKRALIVWHRRSGKTKTLLNLTTKKGFERVGAYYHAFPEYGQGRKIIWDGMDKEGRNILDLHIPPEIRTSTNKTDMKIELTSGSVYQIIGADNYDSLVGPNPVGIIFDEWAVSPRYVNAWNYFRPILVENGGWAVFPYTPRGRNHGWTLYQMAMKNPLWFCQLLTVDDTHGVSHADIQAERESGMSEDMIQQEFYCSFLVGTANILIPPGLVQAAMRRDVDYHGVGRIAGLDVARYGDDRTGLIIRQGGQIIHIEKWGNKDTVFTAGKVINMYKAHLFDAVAVDVIGMGAGVYDMIKHSSAHVPCVSVNVSESPSVEGKYKLLRDEVWWRMREWFQDGACAISRAIPADSITELAADIQDIHYNYTKMSGLVKIESKEDMKKRLGFSPDLGDALACTFAPGIDMKLQQVHKQAFGGQRAQIQNEEYNPLTYGLRG
jgi:hypothetical protein